MSALLPESERLDLSRSVDQALHQIKTCEGDQFQELYGLFFKQLVAYFSQNFQEEGRFTVLQERYAFIQEKLIEFEAINFDFLRRLHGVDVNLESLKKNVFLESSAIKDFRKKCHEKILVSKGQIEKFLTRLNEAHQAYLEQSTEAQERSCYELAFARVETQAMSFPSGLILLEKGVRRNTIESILTMNLIVFSVQNALQVAFAEFPLSNIFLNSDVQKAYEALKTSWAKSLLKKIFDYPHDLTVQRFDFFGEINLRHQDSSSLMGYSALEHTLLKVLKKLIFDHEKRERLTLTRLKVFEYFMDELESKGVVFSEKFYQELYAKTLEAWGERIGLREEDIDISVSPGLYQIQLLNRVLKGRTIPDALLLGIDGPIALFDPAVRERLTFFSETQQAYLKKEYTLSLFRAIPSLFSDLPEEYKGYETSIMKIALMLRDKLSLGGESFLGYPAFLDVVDEISVLSPLQIRLYAAYQALQRSDRESSLSREEFSILARWVWTLIRKESCCSLISSHGLEKEVLKGVFQFLLTWASFPLATYTEWPGSIPFNAHFVDQVELLLSGFHRDQMDIYAKTPLSETLDALVAHIWGDRFPPVGESSDWNIEKKLNLMLEVFSKFIELSQRNPDLQGKGDFYPLVPHIPGAIKYFLEDVRKESVTLNVKVLEQFLKLYWDSTLAISQNEGTRSERLRDYLDYFPLLWLSLEKTTDSIYALFHHKNLTLEDLKTILKNVPSTREMLEKYPGSRGIPDIDKMSLKAELKRIREALVSATLRRMQDLCVEKHRVFVAEFWQVCQDLASEHRDLLAQSASDLNLKKQSRIEALLLMYHVQALTAPHADQAYFLQEFRRSEFFEKIKARVSTNKSSARLLAHDYAQSFLWSFKESTENHSSFRQAVFLFARTLVEDLMREAPICRATFEGCASEQFGDRIYLQAAFCDSKSSSEVLIGLLTTYYIEGKRLGLFEEDAPFWVLLELVNKLAPEIEIETRDFKIQKSILHAGLNLASLLIFSVPKENLNALFFPRQIVHFSPGLGEGALVVDPAQAISIRRRPLGFQIWTSEDDVDTRAEIKSIVSTTYAAHPMLRTVLGLGLGLELSQSELELLLNSDRLSFDEVEIPRLYEALSSQDYPGLIAWRTRLLKIFDPVRGEEDAELHDGSAKLFKSLQQAKTFAEFFQALLGCILVRSDQLLRRSWLAKGGKPKRSIHIRKAYHFLRETLLGDKEEEEKIDFGKALGSMAMLAFYLAYKSKSQSFVFQEFPLLLIQENRLASGMSLLNALPVLSKKADDLMKDSSPEDRENLKQEVLRYFPELLTSRAAMSPHFVETALAQGHYSGLLLLVMFFPPFALEVRQTLAELFHQVADSGLELSAGRSFFMALVERWDCDAEDIPVLRTLCTHLGVISLWGEYLDSREAASEDSADSDADEKLDLADFHSAYDDFFGRHTRVGELPNLFNQHKHAKKVFARHKKFDALRENLAEMTSLNEQYRELIRQVEGDANAKMLKSSRGQVLWAYFFPGRKKSEPNLSSSEQEELTGVLLSLKAYLGFMEERHISQRKQISYAEQKPLLAAPMPLSVRKTRFPVKASPASLALVVFPQGPVYTSGNTAPNGHVLTSDDLTEL